MSSWARVGAKCTCVRTMPEALRTSGAVYPIVGEVYTVRSVVVVTMGSGRGEQAILLREIRNDPSVNYAATGIDSSKEIAMPIDAFRPLITKSQEDDISMFKSLLKPTEVPA